MYIILLAEIGTDNLYLVEKGVTHCSFTIVSFDSLRENSRGSGANIQSVLFGDFNFFDEMKTVAQKMGVKIGSKAYFKAAPLDAVAAINLPDIELTEELLGEFDYIHLFVKRQSEQESGFPELKEHLKLDGMLWVSWPKGGQLHTDLSLPKVISIGYKFGLVESTCLSINSTWSAIKFTHPKKGKIYNNSHAKLQSRTTNR